MKTDFESLLGHKVNRSYDELSQIKLKSKGNYLSRSAFDTMNHKLTKYYSGEKIKFNLIDKNHRCNLESLKLSTGDYFAEGFVKKFQIDVSHNLLPLVSLYVNIDNNFSFERNRLKIFDSGREHKLNQEPPVFWFSYYSYLKPVSIEDLIRIGITNSNSKILEDDEKKLNPLIKNPVEPFMAHTMQYVLPLDEKTSKIFKVLKDAELNTIENYLSIESYRAVKEHFNKKV
jgi:hypothetical protein